MEIEIISLYPLHDYIILRADLTEKLNTLANNFQYSISGIPCLILLPAQFGIRIYEGEVHFDLVSSCCIQLYLV